MPVTCRLCVESHRDEIVKRWKDGVNRNRLFKEYGRYFPTITTLKGFYSMVTRHIENNHRSDVLLVAPSKKKASMKKIAKSLVEMGATELQNRDPSKMSVKELTDIVRTGSGIYLNLEKLKQDQNAGMLLFLKSMGHPGQIEEGEVVDGKDTPDVE